MSTTATRAGQALRLHELASVCGGDLDAPPSATAEAYAIDSRAAAPGVVFFALPGERTDGHRYLADVAACGATASVVRRDAELPPALPCIRVDDVAAALASLGRHFRSHWPLRVVGITGSAGKTTTKDVTAALLASQRRVFKSEGNFNTTIGLPLTLTRRNPTDQIAVLEMGMSFPGELRRVAAIAQPDIAVITNIGLAHACNFDSADDVARAKGEILLETTAGATFVANADDVRVMGLADEFTGNVLTFGIERPADVRGMSIEPMGADGTRFIVEVDGERHATTTSAVGIHQIRNVLAALAVARACELDMPPVLATVATLTASPRRGGLVRLAGGVTLIDDSYNSNPAAVIAALDALATLDGARRIAVLGDMLELGVFSANSHAEVGRHAATRADILLAVGVESARTAEEARILGMTEVIHVRDAAAAATAVLDIVRDGDALLVKGSRGIGLDTVVTALRDHRGDPPTPPITT